MKYIVFDVETNGLLDEVSEMHCIVAYDSVSKRFHKFFDPPSLLIGRSKSGGVEDGIEYLLDRVRSGYIIIGHHISGYDLPLFEKFGYEYDELNPMINTDIYDSMVINNLMWPNELPGLDYWGKKLGTLKPAIEGWDTFTPEILDRCTEDVKINLLLFDHQVASGSLSKTWTKARILEQKVSYIHSQQTMKGIRIDVVEAARLYTEMGAKIDLLQAELHSELPSVVEQPYAGPVNKPFRMDGTLSANCKQWFDNCGIKPFAHFVAPIAGAPGITTSTVARVGGPFSRVTFSPVNLNSHPKVKDVLLGLGWKPTQHNRVKQPDGSWKQTSPKLTEDSYHTLPKGVGRKITEFLSLQHRRRFILNETDKTKGLLAQVRDDGRIKADAFTCATNTGRYRHTGGFVNLPKVTTPYGPEIRGLFTVPMGCTLIGIDLDGIEARLTAHYTFPIDKGAYAAKVLGDKKKGMDIHTANSRALKCDRDTAKTFLYALLYGAGEGKLASILGCSLAEARRRITAFWKENFGIAQLIKSLETEYAREGYITGLDGRHLDVRSSHKLLNTLIQSAAAIVFKEWMVRCYEYTNSMRRGFKVEQILAYHDEMAWEANTPPSDPTVQHVAQDLCSLVDQVQVKLGINVKLEAQPQFGTKYSEVH